MTTQPGNQYFGAETLWLREQRIMWTKVIVAIVLVAVGLVLILAIPTPYEGPLLLTITEQHTIRLADAIGLGVAILSWLYLNLLLVRWGMRRRKLRNMTTDDAQ